MSINSGATTHAFTKEITGINNDMVHINLPFSNITKTPNGVKVMYPDGNTAQATHEAVLNLPILPIAARKVHLFESLASGALISLGKLCDSGCTAYFNATKVYIFFKGKIIMQGARSNATNNLWKVNGTKVEQPTMSLNTVIDKPTIAERIKFYHASLFSPTLDTLAKAVSAGYLTTFPTFTVKQLRKFPPRSEATVKGHMRAQRKGLKQVVIPSPRVNNTTLTQPPIAYVSDDEEEDDEDEDEIESEVTRQELPTQETTTSAQPTSPTLRTNHVYAACLPISGQVYTDQSGKIFVTSASGMNYIFLLYDYDSNLVWAIAIPSRSKLQLLKAYKTAFALLQSRGLKPQLQRIDNECSKILKAYMAEQQVEYQLTPRGKHARNAAEKGIQIWKDHFLAGMATTNPKFPLSRWDKLVEQSNITLNLLRPSRVNPQLSAYAQVFGAFDYSKTPIPPPGMRVLAHVLPKDRASFASHSIPGYSIGPAMEHYRCFKIFVPSTGGTRIADTVRWFPHGDLKMPIASKESLLHAAIQDLSATIKSTVKNSILPPENTTNRKTLLELHELFTKPKATPNTLPRVASPPANTATLPRVAPVQPSIAALPRVVPPPTVAPPPAPLPTAAPSAAPRDRPTLQARLRQQLAELQDTRATPHQLLRRSTRRATSTQKADYEYLNATLSADEEEFADQLANAVLNQETGKMEEYRKLAKGKDKKYWNNGMFNELARLAQGSKAQQKTGTDTVVFKHPKALPSHKKATYARIVANYRPQKADPYRIRITVGGDKLEYAGETYTPNADITTAKILFNSVISTPGGRFLGADLKDFYLGTEMEEYEYMYLQRWIFPQEFIDEYNLEHLFDDKGRILCEIRKGMYGLRQAGRLAYVKLIAHLKPAGYIRAGITPGLFRHTTNDIVFSLVVDDFGIRYTDKKDAQDLIDHLNKQYTCTVDWDGAIFLGMNLEWDYINRTVTITMPGYVKKAIIRFEHIASFLHQYSPHPYTAPKYGAKVQYADIIAADPNLTPEQKKFVQQVVGVFLFYGRTIDSTMLAAIGSIACALSTATWADLKQRVQHFLDYANSNPDAALIYKASDMHLWIHTDASYLTESKARSRAGGFHYFSDKPTFPITSDSPAPMHNHPVMVLCKIIDAVMSSTQESETGSGFINAREGIAIRQAAIEMGHPQEPTPLQFDNLCATRILTGEIKQKQSKSMDMRFYWLRDRALNQKQFNIHWKRGVHNLGDYPTKHHPNKHHKEVRHLYVANAFQLISKAKYAANTLRAACKGVLKTNPPRQQGLLKTNPPRQQGLH